MNGIFKINKRLFCQKTIKTKLEIYRPYTKEEYDIVINTTYKDINEINLFEIATFNLTKAKNAKKFSLFFNLPVSIGITMLSEFKFFEGTKFNDLSGVLFFMDYTLFLFAITTLSGLRSIVVTCDYSKEDKTIIFTKLTYTNKPYIVKEKIEDLERVTENALTPFLTLRNKMNGNKYSMTGTGNYKDFKLYNYLFPHPIYNNSYFNDIVSTNPSLGKEDIVETKKKKDSSKLWDF